MSPVAPVLRIVIPARYHSTRLPGKMLLPVAGRPLLQWTYEQARSSAIPHVLIATDDERIASSARAFGADVVITATHHFSGTDRIAEVAQQLGWPDDDIVVNLQGDEPLMPAVLIEQVAQLLVHHPRANMATLAVGGLTPTQFRDPNVVKVLLDEQHQALYFSRAPVPCDRDGSDGHRLALRHIGIYAYRVAALRKLTQLAPHPLEQCEKLEQLRALAHGLVIQVAIAAVMPGQDVNTAEDLQRLTALCQVRQ
jgi:3-deoxy-manno-octulosonate cytidylyltransferase (CMP-KDO synthetase)